MNDGTVHEVMGQVAGRIEAAAALDAMTDQVQIPAPVEIERRHGPVAHGDFRLLLHLQDPEIRIDFDHPGALELVNFRLVVAHDHGRALLAEGLDESAEGEVQDVVGGNDQQVFVQLIRLQGQQQVPHRSETRLVGEGPVAEHPHRRTGPAVCGPRLKHRCELPVGHDDVLRDLRDGVQVVEHPPEDGAPADFQQGLREILRQRIQPGGIAGRQDDGFHLNQSFPGNWDGCS